jgi:transposase
MIETILPGVAAIDLGAEKFFVALAGQPVRAFGTCTRDLHELAAWLRTNQIKRVAMEATGVLWIIPYDYLESAGFTVTLFHGAHARHLPGRKTDVQDCQWHAMLHGHGLLQPCFVPPEPIRQLRTYCRLREDHLSLAAQHIQHMQRALDAMNVRLHQVLSQLHGVSGLRVIDAIVAGERDAKALAALCVAQVRNTKEAELVASLEGHWQPHHLFALEQALQAYRFCQELVVACDAQIEAQLRAINAGVTPVPRPAGRPVKLTRHNRPQIDDLYGHLLTACGGHDAQTITGLGTLSWLKLLGETGTDLHRHWQSAEHFTGWSGLNPSRHQSGKRCRRVPRRKTKVGQIFREAALSLAKTKDCVLGDFYRRIRGRRGAAVAIVATARKLAVIYWMVMTKGLEYVEVGLAKHAQENAARHERHLRRRAAKLGFTLQPLKPATSEENHAVH